MKEGLEKKEKQMIKKLRDIIERIFRDREFDTLSAALKIAALRSN